MESTRFLNNFEKHPEADSVSAIEESIRRHVKYSLAKPWNDLSSSDLLAAVALSVRNRRAVSTRGLEAPQLYLH